MKTVKVDLEDSDYEIANSNKGNRTWKQVVMGVETNENETNKDK